MTAPALLLLALTACAAVAVRAQTDVNTYVTVRQPAADATALAVDLRVDQWRFEGANGVAAQFWTRVYNGGHTYAAHDYLQPGPLIRVKPGDTLTLNLHNDMGANDDACSGTTLNTIHSPNTTNVHTHGLHISSVEPADSIFTEVEPGGTYTHVYNIPADHAGGTHW